MPDPDLTPEALKRLVERLLECGLQGTPWTGGSEPRGFGMLGEAAAAISALTAERDALARLEAAACERLATYNADMQKAEAKLREIAEIAAERPLSSWQVALEMFDRILAIVRAALEEPKP